MTTRPPLQVGDRVFLIEAEPGRGIAVREKVNSTTVREVHEHAVVLVRARGLFYSMLPREEAERLPRSVLEAWQLWRDRLWVDLNLASARVASLAIKIARAEKMVERYHGAEKGG